MGTRLASTTRYDKASVYAFVCSITGGVLIFGGWLWWDQKQARESQAPLSNDIPSEVGSSDCLESPQEPQTAPTPAFITFVPTVDQNDPVAIVQRNLRRIGREPSISCQVNGKYLVCTALCRDLSERNAILDGFRDVPNAVLTSTKEPPTVSIVLPVDLAAFQREQQLGRQQEALKKEFEEQQAMQRRATETAQRPVADHIKKDPDAFYGKLVSIDCQYAGLERLPGDWYYEVGFAIREKGTVLSCVALTAQITGDPITLSIPVGIADAIRSLRINDRIRVTGRLISPSFMPETGHLRRAFPFFVATEVVRL